jgi:hypothetical protein
MQINQCCTSNLILGSPPAPGLTGVEKLADMRTNVGSRAMTETDSPMVSLYPYVSVVHGMLR